MSDTDTDDDAEQDSETIDARNMESRKNTSNVFALEDVPEDHRTSKMGLIHGDVRLHGEVHAILSEFDAEAELRRGTTTFNYDEGMIRVDAPNVGEVRNFDVEHIVDWYKPTTVFHE